MIRDNVEEISTRWKAQQSRALKKLTFELERLTKLLNLSPKLKVKWMPGRARYSGGRQILGEIINGTIFVYDDQEDAALRTLRHEVSEQLVVEFGEADYVILVNHLIAAFNEIQRQKRHKLVERLSELIDHLGDGKVER
jgi:hypothetical protein